MEQLEDRTVPSLFGPAVNYPVGQGPYSITLADFNGDHKLDMVTANQFTGDVSVLLGNGDGTFKSAANYAAGPAPLFVIAADLRGNGIQDIVVGDNAGAEISVLLGNGDGTFQGAVQYATAGQTVGIVAGDFNGDGKLDLAVANQSSVVSVLFGNGDGTFQAATNYNVGTFAREVATGDFNGDGKLDIVVADQGDNGVSTLINQGNGTFVSTKFFPTGSTPTSIKTADLNGDGKIDVVTANFGSNDVSVLLGNGDGTFQPAVNYAAGNNPHNVAIGDVNGDGKLDIVAADRSGGVSVLLGNGDGTFQTAQSFATDTGGSFSVAIGDLNGDGAADLVTANHDNNDASVLLNASHADTFSIAAQSTTAPGVAFPLTVTAHLPGGAVDTGFTDAVHFTDSDTGEVLPADYTFTAADNGVHTFFVTLNHAPETQTLTVTDRLQPATAGQVTVFVDLNYAASFTVNLPQAAVGYPVTFALTANSSSSGVPASDYNGTVHFTSSDPAAVLPPDFTFTPGSATQTFTVTFYSPGMQTLSTTDTVQPALTGQAKVNVLPLFAAGVNYNVTGTPQRIALGDLNGDANSDLVVLDGGNKFSVLLGRGHGTFQAPTTLTAGSSTSHFSAAVIRDFNGDGHADLLLADKTKNQLILLPGDGKGGFGIAKTFSVGAAPDALAAGDLNGDGKLDIVVADFSAKNVSVLLGDGAGGFSTAAHYTVGANPTAVVLADFNGDGKLDIATAGSSGVSVLIGKGDGTFKSAVTYTADSGPIDLAAGDFNGDGKIDLAVANSASNDVSILLGKGDGTFGAAINHALAASPTAIVLADFNGDGKLDVATAGSNGVTVLLGNGDGTLQNALTFSADQGPAALVAGDLNRDRAPDLVIANSGSMDVSVLLNADSLVTHFSVHAPSKSTAGQQIASTATALTQFGAIDTAYTGSVVFQSSDTRASLPSEYTFLIADQGQHTFNATLVTAGIQTITVSDTLQPWVAGIATVQVTPGVGTQFSITAGSSQTVGVPFMLTVTALDAYGNVATGYRGTVHFTSTDPKSQLPLDYTFTASDQGVHTFQMTWRTAGLQALIVADTKNSQFEGSEFFNVN